MSKDYIGPSLENLRISLEAEPEHKSLDLKEAWNLLVNSFRFSQGSPSDRSDGIGLQKQIFQWVHHNYPGWKLSPEARTGLMKEGPGRFETRFGLQYGPKNPPPLSNESPTRPTKFHASIQEPSIEISQFALKEALELDDALNDEKVDYRDKEQAQASLKTLVEGIIAKDHRNLIEKGKRQRAGDIAEKMRSGQPVEIAHPDQDPFLSHLCYYGFEEEAKRFLEPPFDNMFGQVKDYLLTHSQDENADESWKSAMEKLRQVAALYQVRHPQSEIKIPGVNTHLK